ncbi:MAG: nucleotidyltransferase domain-containing protein [Candidatus Hodarchaeota archaeon]
MQKKSSSSVRIFFPRFDCETIVEALKAKIDALRSNFPISRAILFGSYAKNNYTIRSDIDLLIICKGEVKNAFEIMKKAIALPGLQPHVYSETEYCEMRGTIDRMIQGGIVIYEE